MEERASLLGAEGEQAWIGAVKINIAPLLRDRCEIAKVCHGDFQRHLAPPLRCDIFYKKPDEDFYRDWPVCLFFFNEVDLLNPGSFDP